MVVGAVVGAGAQMCVIVVSEVVAVVASALGIFAVAVAAFPAKIIFSVPAVCVFAVALSVRAPAWCRRYAARVYVV